MSRSERAAERPHRWLVVALMLVCANAGFLGSLAIPLLPLVIDAYDVPLGYAQWSATLPLLIGGVITPVLGRFGSGPHGRKVMLGSLVLMTLGGVLAIPQWSFAQLLVGRGMQGVGLGLAVLAISAARVTLADAHFKRVVGGLSVATITGSGMSFPITSWVANTFGLHSAFGLGALLGAITLALVVATLPAFGANEERQPRLDWLGGVLLVLGSAAAMVVLTQGRPWGWTSVAILVSIAVMVTTLPIWVWWQLRVPHPFVELRAYLRSPILGINVTGMFVGIAIYAVLTMVSLRLQAPLSTGYGLGRTAFAAGCMVLPFSFATMLGSRAARQLRERLSGGTLLAFGSGMTGLGLLGLVVPWDNLWGYALVMALAGVGTGCTFSITPALLAELVPAADIGGALSFSHLLRYLGFTAGGAIAVTILEGVSHGAVQPTFTAHQIAAVGCALASLIGIPTALSMRRQSRSAALAPVGAPAGP